MNRCYKTNVWDCSASNENSARKIGKNSDFLFQNLATTVRINFTQDVDEIFNAQIHFKWCNVTNYTNSLIILFLYVRCFKIIVIWSLKLFYRWICSKTNFKRVITYICMKWCAFLPTEDIYILFFLIFFIIFTAPRFAVIVRNKGGWKFNV